MKGQNTRQPRRMNKRQARQLASMLRANKHSNKLGMPKHKVMIITDNDADMPDIERVVRNTCGPNHDELHDIDRWQFVSVPETIAAFSTDAISRDPELRSKINKSLHISEYGWDIDRPYSGLGSDERIVCEIKA